MADNPRVFALLEEMLESGRSAEEVCLNDPDLLSEVRERWNAFCRIDAEFEALLPSSTGAPAAASMLPAKLPQIPGYQVEEAVGQGGMGIVYRAHHLRLRRPVALKMLLAGDYARPAERERFQREAEAIAALHHPNIVQIYDVGEVDGRPYFTMELVEGGNLEKRIRGVPQPAREAARLVAMLAEAIHRVHQRGIVHRDLKPGNILLTEDGTPKITDFGLAMRQGGERLTLHGSPVGTPSYMAPEQARSDKDAIGPLTDIYALGAILYELLTGRPPFRAETATATLEQVLADEPLAPTRLNPRAPRDLETICLKCLSKESVRRYASAQALADDLHRFERGEPIKARRVGPAERALRWVRRRPAFAGALAAGVLLASVFAICVVWWYGQRMALAATAVAYAEADLSESERLRERGEFRASAAVLERAKDRLGEFIPPELRVRLSTAFDNLALVTRLDSIRFKRALTKPQADHGADQTLSVITAMKDDPSLGSGSAPSRDYEEAFRDAGLGAPEDDPAEVAERVRASPVFGSLVAALDDWAACVVDRDRQHWIAEVVRRADPDPWRDRVRDPATWDNAESLGDLAAKAAVAEQSPQLLSVLAARLRVKKVDATEFLGRVASAYPADFWVNIEMGNALYGAKPVEATGYFRTALALRPEAAFLHYVLGGLYLVQRRWDDCIMEFEQAVRGAPDNAWCHNRLGFALAWRGGHDDEAIDHFREAVRLDTNMGWSHYFLAIALERKGCLDEAVDEFRAAASLLPEKRTEARQRLRGILIKLGRASEVCASWKDELAAYPPAHDDWFGYAELCLFLEDEAEYGRARRALLAQFAATTDLVVAERVGRSCLLLPATEDESGQAVALTECAVAGGRSGHELAYPYRLFAQGLARYRQGRFDDAVMLMNGEAAAVMGPSPRLVLAMAQHRKGEKDEANRTLNTAISSYDWSASKADNLDAWIAHILRREAQALILANGPPFLDGEM